VSHRRPTPEARVPPSLCSSHHRHVFSVHFFRLDSTGAPSASPRAITSPSDRLSVSPIVAVILLSFSQLVALARLPSSPSLHIISGPSRCVAYETYNLRTSFEARDPPSLCSSHCRHVFSVYFVQQSSSDGVKKVG
jgi:hypothetical protein